MTFSANRYVCFAFYNMLVNLKINFVFLIFIFLESGVLLVASYNVPAFFVYCSNWCAFNYWWRWRYTLRWCVL